MVRTITAIQGEYGLPKLAQSDMFSSSEESVLKNIEKAVAQQNSQTIEQMAGRGMGRSSFTEGLMQQKQADIYGNVFNQFAQNRMGYDTQLGLQQNQYQNSLGLQSANTQNQLQAGTDYLGRSLPYNLATNMMSSNAKGGNTGSSLGGLVGSAFGPLGSIAGSILGGLFG